MSHHTALTVPTQFVEANGIRFAYRRFGKQEGIPLLFNHHFTGNLDNWDPSVTDGIARSSTRLGCSTLTFPASPWAE
jgi:pimeloyl-ACP methyl ester carboxylesterase